MASKINIKSLIKDIDTAPDYQAEKLDHLHKKEDINDRRSDRILKRFYAGGLGFILFVQLLIMDSIMYLVGKKTLTYEGYILEIFVSGLLLEVFGLVAIVTNSLFKNNK